MSTDISEMLGAVYFILDTLGMIIIFNLLYLVVMYILYFKKTKRGQCDDVMESVIDPVPKSVNDIAFYDKMTELQNLNLTC